MSRAQCSSRAMENEPVIVSSTKWAKQRLPFPGDQSLPHAVKEFLAPCHGERNHRRIIAPSDAAGHADGAIVRRGNCVIVRFMDCVTPSNVDIRRSPCR